MIKVFIESRLTYSLFLRMFSDARANNKINHIYKRAWRTIYKIYDLPFTDDLVRKDNLNSIHHVNIKALGKELLRIKNHLSNQIACSIFPNQNILSTMLFFFNTNSSENKTTKVIEQLKTKIRHWEHPWLPLQAYSALYLSS